MRPSASVIICAYTVRRLPVLRTAVTAVLEQMNPSDELLVVIDHNDELLEAATEMVSELDHHQSAERGYVRVLPNVHPVGLSGARNSGIAAATGGLVVSIDDDAIPRPGWLARLTEPFADPEVIGVGGVASPDWEREPPRWWPQEFLWVVGCSYRGLPERPCDIRNPIGANMAFRRSVVEQVGGFTDGIGRIGGLPLGCEETELSIRAARATGGRIIQQPTAVVDHAVTTDRLRFAYFVRRCWAEGVSKAVVARLTSGDAALASERRYVTRTLPAGVAAGLRDGLVGRTAGFARAAAIVGGLAATVAGYLLGSARSQSAAAPQRRVPLESGFEPIWSGEMDLAAPTLPVRLSDSDGRAFERSRLLIRAAGTPLGFVDVTTPDGEVDLEKAVEMAQLEFGDRVQSALTDTGWSAAREELVSVVLCTHNRPAGARGTLESVRALKHRNLEIIVVDSAPHDTSTHRLVTEMAQHDARVRYVREDRLGLSRARNRGLQEAAGDLVAFTDDDVTVDPLWINGLLRGMSRETGVGCVTGLVASRSLRHPAEQYFDRRVWWSSSCDPRVFTEARGDGDSPLHPYTAGAFGTGANFCARAAVLRSLGGFDECLGAGSPPRGGEDLDMFVRVITAGHSLSYEPSALVWHDHRVDDASLQAQMYAYGTGLTAYLTKHILARRSRGALARRIPGGLWHALSLIRRSHRAALDAAFAGKDLTAVEVRGMLVGPLLYLRARRHAHMQRLDPDA